MNKPGKASGMKASGSWPKPSAALTPNSSGKNTSVAGKNKGSKSK